MSTSWRRLHLSQTAGLPPLLYKYISTSTSYEVYMTDLTSIWSEHLSRQAILKRADEDSATIDPSEDPEQFEMLLQKISDALQNVPGSSATLLQHGTASSLELITTTKLPAPLEPLKWKLQLAKEPPSATTTQLLFPLIEAEVSRASRQQMLVDQLGKKDWVLGKLFDKIETVGLDLSTIFPGMSGLRASSRKGTTLAQAAKYIKGVAPFNEQAWLEEIRRSSPDADLASNIFTEVSVSGSGDTKLCPPPDAWWEDLSTVENDYPRPRSPVRKESPGPELQPSKDDVEMDTDTGAETEDDEFERQETPPRLKHPQSPEQPKEEEEQETDDESAPGSPLPARKNPPTKPPPKGLGMIGGHKRQPQKKPSPTPEHITTATKPPPTPPKQTIPTNDDNDQTDSASASESDDLEDHPPPPPKSPKPKPKPKPTPAAKVVPATKARGLGTIGGKKKEPLPPSPPAPAASPSPSPSPQKPPASQFLRDQDQDQDQDQQRPETSTSPTRTKRLGKLGVIGGKASKPQLTESSSPLLPPPTEKEDVGPEEKTRRPKLEATRSPFPRPPVKKTPTVQPEEPKKEETEQERADRKREELKRQLEAKAKAPAKKKRKF